MAPAAGLDEAESEELGLVLWTLLMSGAWRSSSWSMTCRCRRTCDTVAVDHGNFVTRGAPQEVRHHPKVIESYLGEDSPEDGTRTSASIESGQS